MIPRKAYYYDGIAKDQTTDYREKYEIPELEARMEPDNDKKVKSVAEDVTIHNYWNKGYKCKGPLITRMDEYAY